MNKNLECVQVNWKSLGAKLANLSNEEQYDFFSSFADEMNRYPSQHARDLQIFYFTQGTNPSDKPFTDKQHDVYATLAYKEKE